MTGTLQLDSPGARPFEQLIARIAANDFFAHHFERAPLVVNRATPGFYDPMLRFADIEAFLCDHAAAEDLALIRDSVGAPRETWTMRRGGRPRVNPDAVLALIDQGYSLRVAGAHQVMPRLRRFLARLQDDLQLPLQANLYASPLRTGALRPHYDSHDVLVLQISGTKSWRLYDTPVAFPTDRQSFGDLPYAAAEPEQRFELSAGDLAYVPRGLVNAAETSAGLSVHLAIGLPYATGFDLVQELARRLDDDPALRRALGHGYDGGLVGERATAVASALAVADTAAAGQAAMQSALRQHGLPPLPRRSLRDLATSGPTIDDRVVQRADAAVTVTQLAGALHISTESTAKLEVQAFLAPAVERLLAGPALRVGELPGLLSDEGKCRLVAQFIALGVVELQHD